MKAKSVKEYWEIQERNFKDYISKLTYRPVRKLYEDLDEKACEYILSAREEMTHRLLEEELCNKYNRCIKWEGPYEAANGQMIQEADLSDFENFEPFEGEF